MTWVLTGVVVYLLASLWALRRAHDLEGRITRAHVTLLWRRVGRINGDAVPVQEVYEELRKLGAKDADAWYWSRAYAAAVDAGEGENGQCEEEEKPDRDLGSEHLEELDVQVAQETARDYYTDMAHCDYLSHAAQEKLDRELPLWRMRHAKAALALDELNKQHYRPLRGRNGHDDPIDAYFSLERDERQKMDDERARKYKDWKEQYPEAARAYDDMIAKVYREVDEYEAIRTMSEMVEARKRDYEQRARARPPEGEVQKGQDPAA